MARSPCSCMAGFTSWSAPWGGCPKNKTQARHDALKVLANAREIVRARMALDQRATRFSKSLRIGNRVLGEIIEFSSPVQLPCVSREYDRASVDDPDKRTNPFRCRAPSD